ncbi:hypothetical protein F5144DRAFT_496836 [Chaetomium tenue]|uniref:Uncharacterized protein n=1 Tax=Chaetomium tenue TaxID=1854479 RepID=A0ACB7P091_9PEZI|nr:hypothetical protein F5144DRAFT_496836 [Chaetomium globosum]
MGSALSRCTSRSSGAAPSGLSEMGQKILDRQPNWIIPPARWRTQTCSEHPVRYRTPTPYPKEDRKRMEEPASNATVVVPEKAFVLESSTVSHVEVVSTPHKHGIVQQRRPHAQAPQTLKITWEMSPRLNRFERVA